MKSILATFSFITMLFSCNFSDKKISQIEIKKTSTDTILTIKEPLPKITKAFVLGKFNYKSDSTFIKLNPQHTTKDIYLNIEVADALLDMLEAAKADGIKFKILSGTRNFEEQKIIWERKWRTYNNLIPLDRAKKILTYSSMPSTSRHHWGTDIDLNSLNNSYFNSGEGKLEYNWLLNNAHTYGFYQVYTNKESGRTGYNLEKWHWSYMPLANQYLTYYNENITIQDLNGFKGSELAKELNIIDNYVNGISETIKTYIKN
jgi:LAS superfamily LD-carboxypeptidase LdcB